MKIEVGQNYGVYKVLSKDEEKSREKRRIYWKCECLKCHNILSVRDDGVKRLPNNCPECKNSLLNQTFGRLTVIAPGKVDKNGHKYWVCQCSCGNKVEVNGDNLRRQLTLSCGCYQKEQTSKALLIDLTGKRFGKLTVLKKSSNRGEKVRWLCKCDCGTILEVEGANLKSGHTTSCGCIRSKGENKIAELLNLLNISFEKEYTFSDLPKRRFDFYLPDKNLCIEFDGKQHFTYVATWHGSLARFEESKKRDEEKNNYCKEHGIKLIRIPYYDYDLLTTDYLLSLINE